jgi:hypothetical protein
MACITQVADALRVACGVRFTDQMVSEVWDVIGQMDSARSLVQRSNGTWVRTVGAGFLV